MIIYPLEIISANGSPWGKNSEQLFPSEIIVRLGRMKEEGTVGALAHRVQSCSVPLGGHLFPRMTDPLISRFEIGWKSWMPLSSLTE